MTLFAYFGDNDILDETFPYFRSKSLQIIVCTIMTGIFDQTIVQLLRTSLLLAQNLPFLMQIKVGISLLH